MSLDELYFWWVYFLFSLAPAILILFLGHGKRNEVNNDE